MPKKPAGPPTKSSLTWQVHKAYNFDRKCDRETFRQPIEPSGAPQREYDLDDSNRAAEMVTTFAAIEDESTARAWLETFGLPVGGCSFDELILMGKYFGWLNALLLASIAHNQNFLDSCLSLPSSSQSVEEYKLREQLSQQQTKTFMDRRRLKDLENCRTKDQFEISFRPPNDSIYWWSETSPGCTDGINQDWWLANCLLFTPTQWESTDIFAAARWYVAMATEDGTRGMGLTATWSVDPKTRTTFLKPQLRAYCPWHVVNYELFKLAISEADLEVCRNCAKVFTVRDSRMKYCADQCTKQAAYKARKQKGQ